MLDQFLSLLNYFQKTNISKKLSKSILQLILNNPSHTIFIVEFNNRVIAASTLILEPKFIHGGKYVGHIEDVIVHPKYRHQKIGSTLIKMLLKLAENNNCYKTILNCDELTQPFYEKLGFYKVENCMRVDYQ